ncbi:MAG: acyl-CoA dehydrogenase family protein [Pyrinomonadaceae bacterium]
MNFDLTEEQELVRSSVREFANAEIAPLAREYDEQEKFPKPQLDGLGAMGFLGMIIPEEYGGAGFDAVSYAIALEEISRADASVAVIVSVTNSVCCYPILHFGTEEQKQKYLVPLATGKKLGAFCLSEPQAGSDATNLKTHAKRNGAEFILNGTKSWVTNGGVADTYIVMAVTGDSGERKEISAFIVDGGSKGLSVSSVEHKLGQRASRTTEMSFEDVCVPEENLLGGLGNGMKVAFSSLDNGRIGIASLSVGIAQAAFEEATAYSKDRIAFGKPISANQAISFMLADMATEIEAARLLTLRAAAMKEANSPKTGVFASMAKLFASEMANRVCADAIQIHGGNGYSRHFNVEKFYRDARITTIYEGTSEIQKIVISRNLLA